MGAPPIATLSPLPPLILTLTGVGWSFFSFVALSSRSNMRSDGGAEEGAAGEAAHMGATAV